MACFAVTWVDRCGGAGEGNRTLTVSLGIVQGTGLCARDSLVDTVLCGLEMHVVAWFTGPWMARPCGVGARVELSCELTSSACASLPA